MAEKLAVVTVKLIHQDIQHRQNERAIGSRTDRHPFVCFSRGVGSYRVDNDDFHPPAARVGHLTRRHRGIEPGHETLLIAQQDSVVAVIEIEVRMKRTVGEIH